MKRILSVIVLYSFLSISANAGPVFMGLGDLPGGDYRSRANAISSDGTTIVGTSFTTLGQEGFRWTFNGGMVGIGDLSGGVFGSQALDVSADGSIIVGNSGSSFGTEAFRWTAKSGMVGLGDLSGGSFISGASGVSADGTTIVGRSRSGIFNEAFQWTAESGMVGLGFFPEGISSKASAVSGDGTVIVGENGTIHAEIKAFRWTAETGTQSLLSAEEDSSARAVSADGSMIVGTFGNIISGPGFLWLDDGQIVDLGDFVPNAISDDGSVIVGMHTVQPTDLPPPIAFIWDPIHGARDLQSILETDFNLDLEGWDLRNATDVSADGTVIVGYGINPAGDIEAWVAVVPEPATLLLLGAGAIMWFRKRR